MLLRQWLTSCSGTRLSNFVISKDSSFLEAVDPLARLRSSLRTCAALNLNAAFYPTLVKPHSALESTALSGSARCRRCAVQQIDRTPSLLYAAALRNLFFLDES